MRRREFLGVVGSATLSWLGEARAQRVMPVVGIIYSGSSAGSAVTVSAFREGLKEAGFAENQNVALEFRFADNHLDRLAEQAAELAQRPVAVIVGNTLGAKAAKAATSTVPIVVALSNDPVADGLVASYNRPGGNVTGLAFLSAGLGTKRLGLLRQVVPGATTIGVLMNPEMATTIADRDDVQAAAQRLGQQVVMVDVRNVADLEPAFAKLMERSVGALLVGGGPFMFSNRDRVVGLTTRFKLPASYPLREYVAAGGLMSYGNSITDDWRQAGIYAGRILKGEKPADMPVSQSDKFEFVINLKTAKALGIEIHPQLLATADEVIE
jgi:putative tryptophan/tyrosine transport system substrate-binding protein